MSPRKTPKQGADGLFPWGKDHPTIDVRMGDKIVKVRADTDPKVRILDDDEYAGPPKGDAA